MVNCTTKAQTLESMYSRLSKFKVPDFFYFTTADFQSNPDIIVNRIKHQFNEENIIVRSSAIDEDSDTNTLAGEYDSVLNVPSADLTLISDAINTVIHSYSKNGIREKNDEILIQRMISDVSMSGVIFTHDLNTGAPYYVINYDDISGLTDTVTSGDGEHANRTLYVYREKLDYLHSERFQKLLKAVQELEKVMGSKFLDIEFALSKDLVPYLLQVRAITTQPQWSFSVTDNCIKSALIDVETGLKKRFQRVDGVFGKTTVLGQMPDWNPAEMIGRAPRALAFSLYEKLITNHTWYVARELMGYATPTGHPLMVSLSGQPFIDTRLSFHSYLPCTLSPDISEKLVDRWVGHLKDHPELHDKVEFEIAITTYSFDIDQKLQELVGGALNKFEKNEFKTALYQQTKKLLIGDGEYGISQALRQIEELTRKNTQVDVTNYNDDLSTLLTMIEDCIRLGTIPFSILARHGFIARTLLLSLHQCGILTMDDVNYIQSSVKTVAGEFVDDMRRFQLGTISRVVFMERYGHLRPGTYDILSHRYDQMDGLDLGTDYIFSKECDTARFSISDEKLQQIDKLLEVEGFEDINAEKLIKYIKSATQGREYGKFIFTRSVSNILEWVAKFGESHNLTRDDLSNIPIDNLLHAAKGSNMNEIESSLKSISKYEKKKHAISVAIRLPQVLSDTRGAYVTPFQVSHPNFITHKKIVARCIVLSARDEMPLLNGKIVIIENADPGFDWIFSQQIGGLITKYGGVNSHMAIRCAEFGIPAAIGCGEQRFETFLEANQILLDCAAGLVSSLH